MKTKLAPIILLSVIAVVALVISAIKLYPSDINDGIDPKVYGSVCKLDRICNGIAGINCNSEVDGPYYYVDQRTKVIMEECGGRCMTTNCTNCPPKEWTCN